MIADGNPITKWAQRYFGFGAGFLDAKDRRGGRICNILSLVGTATSIVFGINYLIQDPHGLIVPALVCFAVSPLFFITPLMTRFGIMAATSMLVSNLTLLTLTNTFLLSREADLHTALIINLPVVGVLVLGVNRLKPVLVYALCGLAASIIPEIYFTEPSNLVTVDQGFLLGIRLNIMIANGVILTGAIFYSVLRMTHAEEALEAEYAKSEGLLENLLPKTIAKRLKSAPDTIIADKKEAVTILFADVVDFTTRAASMPAEDLVTFLNEVFTAFDAETEKRGLEKIKTIGDAYMVVAGLPEQREDHAAAIADLALEMIEISARLSQKRGETIAVRIGIHTGPAVAGVIGRRKVFYDVWGDTVNTAARMESHGSAGRIQITAETRASIAETHITKSHGLIDVKGKGPIETWWLINRR